MQRERESNSRGLGGGNDEDDGEKMGGKRNKSSHVTEKWEDEEYERKRSLNKALR